MNYKNKLKSMKPQNIFLPSSCKVYINKRLCKYYKYLWWKCKFLQTCGSIKSFWVTNGLMRIRHHNDEVKSVAHIEDVERHFLEDDLCDNSNDEESPNKMNFISYCVLSVHMFRIVCKVFGLN